MTTKLLVLAGGVLAAAVIVPEALELHAYRQKVARGRFIDQEHCDRIEAGMRQEEVEAILGGPPGDFRTRATLVYDWVTIWGEDGSPRLDWRADTGLITVALNNEEGTVRAALFTPTVPMKTPSWTEQLRTGHGR